MRNKAFFFDRDGIINHRIVDNYVTKPDEFILFKEIPEILIKIKQYNYKIFVVTNQQGVGKGIMSVDQLEEVHNYMQNELNRICGIRFDDIAYCTDLRGSGSPRRKPAAGMLLELAEKWNIDLSSSYMIGDSESDILAGKNAGTKTIFVNSSNTLTDSDFVIYDVGQLPELIMRILIKE